MNEKLPRTTRFCQECGGETQLLRRWEENLLVTWLVCAWKDCGYQKRMLDYNEETKELRDWTSGEPVVVQR